MTSSPYPRRCPRCGITLAPDQPVHRACVRARVWQVAWPIITLVLIVLGSITLLVLG